MANNLSDNTIIDELGHGSKPFHECYSIFRKLRINILILFLTIWGQSKIVIKSCVEKGYV